MTDKLSIKDNLIKQAVIRLRNFGFIHVTEENITTDEVYSLYFFKILNDMLGEHAETDIVIRQLLNLMDLYTKAGADNK